MRVLVGRLAQSILLLWIVATLTFVLLRAAPGDPAALLIAPSASAADVARARAALGLNRPLPVQYARWGRALLEGNLGESFVTREPVSVVLERALPVSLGLGLSSLLLTFLVGILVGTVQAAQRGGRVDTTLTVASTAVYAAPSYWLSLALVALFTYGAARWGFPPALRLPAFGMRDPAGGVSGWGALPDLLRHAILPVCTLTAIGAAGIARYSRTLVSDVTGLAFVQTARAKGVSRATLYLHHVLRNALAPLVVLFALALPGVLAGSVFVETVFAWPGMGRLLVNSILARDYPVVMGATVLYAALVIFANLAGDLALPALDPRRRS
ncbi:MAG TPA: ABC transporter permease [Gemmatimonadaceae bacterium]|nr:ABC transporter permease [Gemmatimonadaceae bacterium]